MPYTVYVTPTATNDLTAAIEYYNSVSSDLGFRFADIIAQYFERIAALPTTSAIRYKTFAASLLKNSHLLSPMRLMIVNRLSRY